MRKISGAIAAIAMLGLSAPAAAGEIWLNGWSSYSSAGSGDLYFTDGTVNVRVSAWSIAPNNVIRQASLGMWEYGLGVQHSSWNPSGPANYGADGHHTVDNSGWTDFLVFQFDQAVELENGFFWSDWDGLHDTDATIGYGDFASPYNQALNLNNQNISALSGFSQYLSLDNSGDETQCNRGRCTDVLDSSYRNINPEGNVGNFWLVGAAFTNPDKHVDGFKLKKLTYDIPTPPPPAVPEPGTWLMMILGFGLIGGFMRRRKAEDGRLALTA